MAGYRVRVLRLPDLVVIFDSEGSDAQINATIVDMPGVGSWNYILQAYYGNGTGTPLYMNRNTLSALAVRR